MRQISLDDLGNALAQPWLAILATFRSDGTPLLSPVWYEWDGSAFIVSLRTDDWKERHIRRRGSNVSRAGCGSVRYCRGCTG